jgi:hypothetical protein
MPTEKVLCGCSGAGTIRGMCARCGNAKSEAKVNQGPGSAMDREEGDYQPKYSLVDDDPTDDLLMDFEDGRHI